MNKPFTIIQNDRTRESFIRCGDQLIEAEEAEFDALRTLAIGMRGAPDPVKFMDTVVKEWRAMEEDEGLTGLG